MSACGRLGPCNCAVCNLTRVAAHDASTAAYCRSVDDHVTAARYEEQAACARRAIHRLTNPPWSDAPPGVRRAASSRP